MIIPPYFIQQKSTTCSLAVLRMVLSTNKINVEEKELIQKVEKDYGKKFKNIWNPTIAKLSCQYGIKTTLIANWPLLKKENSKKALKEYIDNPTNVNYKKYENPEDNDQLPEPLPLGYKEMFEALKLGCKTEYKKISKEKLKKLLDQNYLLLVSIKLQKLYDNKKGYHSILIFGYTEDIVHYHDPSYGENLTVNFNKLLNASQDAGANIAFTTV